MTNDKKQKHIVFLTAFLALALPCRMAMAADANWQTPQPPVAAAIVMAANTPLAATQGAAPVDVNAPKLFQITKDDIASAVAEQLQQQGVEKKASATVIANENVIYSADHALQLSLHGLQIDPTAHRWQAQAYILSNHQTEIVKPLAGFYEAIATVPMLTKQTSRTDIIAATDITLRDVPERQLRKDTITDAQALIGKSPRVQISPNRPIRSTEISNPVVIHRGDPVEMTFTAPYMHIKTTGIALDDGELDGMLRVKNTKSEKAVTTRVTGAGKVEANLEYHS